MADSKTSVLGVPFSHSPDGPINYILNFEEIITSSDNYSYGLDDWDLFFNEPVGVTDTYSRHYTLNYSETISVQAPVVKNFPKTFTEAFTVSAPINRSAHFYKSFSVPIAVAAPARKVPDKNFPDEITYTDSLTKRIYKNVTETLLVFDTLLKNASAVFFDLVIRDDVLTKALFDELADSPPVGYTPFRQFHPGDYDFQEFMVGLRLTGPENEGQAGVLGLRHIVDVADVTDRGEATVTAGEAAGTGEHIVTFSKTFTAIPEVYTTWKSGAVAAVPEIVSVTSSQFTFILRQVSSPATVVEGTITWAAIGR